MRILSVEIKDILSIESASLSFEDNGLVLVEGWNHDTQRSNGAGKTAIFNCLSFALYDKLPRKITASEVVRRGAKTGSVICKVLCGQDTWTVERFRPKGVKFYKNDVEQNISQEEFESYTRLTYQQFLLTIYTPQSNSGSLTRFLSSPDSSKKEFLLQLLNLDKFSAAKKNADELVKQRQTSIDLESNKLETYKARVETYQESLIDVDLLVQSLLTLQESVSSVNDELIDVSAVAKPDLSKYTATEDTIRVKQSEISQAKAKRSLLHDKYRDLTNAQQVYGPQSCGECGSSLDTPEARALHADHQEKLKQKILDTKNLIDSLDVVISKEQSITDLAKKIRDKKQQESADYQTAQIRANELKSFLKTKQVQIENTESKINKNAELINKIKDLDTKIEDSLLTITTNKQDLELYKTLSSIYSPTGAQAYVLDSVVDTFNEIIQKYIDILSPDMAYILNSFKETAKGDVVAKFSETLSKAGEVVSVGSLSGGEEKGLSLCVDFALLEVLETQFGMSLNPIILDEPFDGLDAAGREIVIDLLENLARNRQIFVIDHSSEAKSMFSKVVRVELKNKISTVSIGS